MPVHEGHLESSWHGIITPQCLNKMLSNNTCLEARNQRLLDGLIFVEKGHGVQCMLKISKVDTLAEFLSKIFVKNEGNWPMGILYELSSLCFGL